MQFKPILSAPYKKDNMLFESDKPMLEVYAADAKQSLIASFIDGKFETEDPKTIKTLKALDGVHEVKLEECNDIKTNQEPNDNKKKVQDYSEDISEIEKEQKL